MIYDVLENAERYYAVHPGFRPAFEYLRRTDFAQLPTGRNEVDGDRLFVVMNRDTGQGRDARKLEFHRKYIDLQFVVEGCDEMGWRAESLCRETAVPYKAEADVGFWAERPVSYFNVQAGQFAIFYPDDPHAPMSGREPFVKPVMKIAVDWQ